LRVRGARKHARRSSQKKPLALHQTTPKKAAGEKARLGSARNPAKKQRTLFMRRQLLSIAMLSEKEGAQAVSIARGAVESFLASGKRPNSPEMLPARLLQTLGVFVTIKSFPQGELRGCIGFPEPFEPLAEGIVDAAIAAAAQDPRFPPLEESELESVTFEVSVLTAPEELLCPPAERKAKIRLGRHGLIIRRGGRSGLLLPQVPGEQGWDEEEFLCGTCMKAGLAPDAWLGKECAIYTFEAQVFSETKPAGEARRRAPTPHARAKLN
jgi:uncharacterized protein (TIGR00296 family)